MKILLLHGWGENSPYKTQRLCDALEVKGHEVFLPHMPGFGDEITPQKPWSVNDYAEWVIKKIQEKGWDEYILFGHSFGGRIAVKILAKNPKEVKGLILCAAPVILHTPSLRHRIIRDLSTIGKRFFSYPFIRIFSPLVHNVWRKIFYRKDYYKVSGVMRETFLNIIREDLQNLLPSITVPTLILWGAKDNVVSVEDAYAIDKLMPNSQLSIYPEGDHFLPYNPSGKYVQNIDTFVKSL